MEAGGIIHQGQSGVPGPLHEWLPPRGLSRPPLRGLCWPPPRGLSRLPPRGLPWGGAEPARIGPAGHAPSPGLVSVAAG